MAVKPNSSNRRQDAFLLLFSGFVGLFSPLVVTWDSYLYVGSGYAISHDLMESQYHWLREPLYPVILNLFDGLGSYRPLLVIQTISIMMALILWSNILKHFGLNPNRRNRVFIILLSFSFLWGFGGTLLLQAFWILFSALLIYLLSQWSTGEKKFLPFVSLLLILIQSLSSVFFFCSTLAVALVIITKKVFERKNLFFSIGLVALVFMPSLTSFGAWEYFKGSHSLQGQIYKDSTRFWNTLPYNGWNNADKIIAIPSAFLALNSMGIEFYQSGYYPTGTETRTFGMPEFKKEEACGKFYPGPEKYLVEATLPTVSSCVVSDVLIDFSNLNKVIKYSYPFVVWIGFLSIVRISRKLILERSAKLLSILFFILLIQIPYLISNAAISRLGIPTTLVFLLVGSTKLVEFSPRFKNYFFRLRKSST